MRRGGTSLFLVLFLFVATEVLIGLDVIGGLLDFMNQVKKTPPTSQQPKPKGPTRLFWPTLESSPGRAVGFREGKLVWECNFLAEQTLIDLRKVMMLEEARPTEIGRPAASWRIRFKTGDMILAGEVSPQKEGLICRRCTHGGEITAKWPEIAAVDHLDGPGVIYTGPTGIAGWESGPYFPTSGGAIATRMWNKTAGTALTLPDMVKIDIEVRSTSRPDFEMWLFSAMNSKPRLETWKNELVLVSHDGDNTRFTPLKTLGEDDREVRLTLCWDKKKDFISAFGPDGSLLGTLRNDAPPIPKTPIVGKTSGATTSKEGVFFFNRGLNLVVEHVSVTKWDGENPEPVDIVTELTGENGSFLVNGRPLAPSDAVRIVADHGDMSLEARPLKMRAIWAGGIELNGDLSALTVDDITMTTAWSTKPVCLKRENLMRVMFGPVPRAEAITEFACMDVLRTGGINLHGTLDAAEGLADPRWLLEGATKPVRIVRPSDGTSVEVQRAAAATEPTRAEAMAFLASGEVVRADFTGATEQAVDLRTPLSGAVSLPAEKIKAVHWIKGTALNEGFRDAGWGFNLGVAKKGKLTLGGKPIDDKVELEDGALFGHDSLATGEEIRFRFKPMEGWGGLQVGLFVADRARLHEGSFVVTLYRSGDTLYLVPGGNENRGVSDEQMLRSLTKDTLDVRMSFSDGKVQVFVDDVRLLEQAVEDKQSLGNGLVFKSSSLWGNTARGVTVSGFKISPKPGYLPVLRAPPAAKAEALTVPRFRRDNMPTHALVAPNGDLVRGRVELATERSVRFISGLEAMDVPRDRIKAMVWLQKPTPVDQGTAKVPTKVNPSDDERWLLLNDGSRLKLKLTEFGTEVLRGESEALGACEVPLSSVSMVMWTPPPMSRALTSHTDWQLKHAPEPVLPEGGGSSPLLGKNAPDFKLPMLYKEQEFALSETKGKVVVLDFWATWCGPCTMLMPENLRVAGEFGAEKVCFIAVNQAEDKAAVKRFIEQRGWKLDVVMDAQQQISRKYLVEALPHLVVIDPKGQVSWVAVGAASSHAEKLREAITKALSVKP